MAGAGRTDGLQAGVAEVEITPPVGTPLCGDLQPRDSVGVQDPLYAKAIVLQCGGRRLAYVALDLIGLPLQEGEEAVSLASQRTGIPATDIVWAATHTHTGPYTGRGPGSVEGPVNREWLDGLPDKFAEAVGRAHASLRPAKMSRLRGFHHGLAHNRRVMFKDGRAINTWNLGNADERVQSVGLAGPTDPEIGMLTFDDEHGELLAVLFHFSLHTNTNFGDHFSADYPGVVAARLRERFGPRVSTLFLPGAFGDLNCWGRTYREVGDALADAMIPLIEQREGDPAELRLAATKRRVWAVYRDFTEDQEERIRQSGWPPERQEVFREGVEALREAGKTGAETLLQAWRIGEVAFASLPGELFVEWGLKIKRESPFPWTYPVELGGDSLGYLVTPEAAAAGGYEPLSKVSADAVGHLVDEALEMLEELHSEEAS
ncbi:MAG: hypothetical protein R6X33_16825 [Candidatus Brocadiia bacterium]